MWVLEARADAEKIWYPIVWEKTKDASNVIDYNINEEITTDTSAVFNANNDTTTGMATVIPWVNEPRLLSYTSIYDNKNLRATATASAIISVSLWPYGTRDWQMRPLSLSDEWWDFKFSLWEYYNWWSQYKAEKSCVVIPVNWLYEVKVKYHCTVGNWKRQYDLYVNLDNVYHFQDDTYAAMFHEEYPTETVILDLKAGDQVAFLYRIKLDTSNTWTSDVSIDAVFTKI